MIIYKDLLTGDEIISDTYDLKDIDDAVFEVDCKMVTVGGNVEVDIGFSDGAKIKGAEGGEEEGNAEDGGLEESSAQVNNVIDAFRLNQMPPYDTKERFVKDLKAYLSRLSKKLTEDGADEGKVKSITDGIKKYASKKLAPKIKDFEPYVGESFDAEVAIWGDAIFHDLEAWIE
ncbi:hypothetical protein ACLMJK_002476 [Lecanora helva]